MKATVKIGLVVSMFFVLQFAAKAQTNTTGGVSIVQGAVPPHESSMLDVVSTNKGVLIPRMSSVQRKAITPLTEGLLVYDTDFNSFFYVNIEGGNPCWKMLDNHKVDNTTPVPTGVSNASCNESDGKIPVGGIIMYANVTGVNNFATDFTAGVGNGKYKGWFVCDGLTYEGKTVPNMVDRFVVGVSPTKGISTSGGSNQVTLTIDQMPAHNHDVASTSLNVSVPPHTHPITDKEHSHTFPAHDGTKGGMADRGGKDGATPSTYGTSSATTGITATENSLALTATVTLPSPFISTKGGGQAVDFTPKYYAVVYIIRLY